MSIIKPNFITERTVSCNGDVDITYNCACNSCKKNTEGYINYNTFDDLKTHMKSVNNIDFFKCPVPSCDHTLPTYAGVITQHIKESHPKIRQKLHLDENNKTAIYCKGCDSYTGFTHFHCRDCKHDNEKSLFFKTKDELISHLKEKHPKETRSKQDDIKSDTKYNLETLCKFKAACYNFHNGKCGFNHHEYDNTYIYSTSIPSTMCKWDAPWKNIRCKNNICPFDHLIGRVIYITGKKEKPSTNKKDINAPFIDDPPTHVETPSSSNKMDVPDAPKKDEKPEEKTEEKNLIKVCLDSKFEEVAETKPEETKPEEPKPEEPKPEEPKPKETKLKETKPKKKNSK